MNKILLTTVLSAMSAAAMAQPTTEKGLGLSFYEIVLAVIFVMLVFVMLMLAFTLKKVVEVLKREISGAAYAELAEPEEEELTGWEKLLSLKPLSSEKEVELDHDFDGIKELNNPIPFWFNLLFSVTIVVAFVYILVYHVFNAAPLQAQEYKTAMADAELAKQEYVKLAGNQIDENSVVMLTDASKIKSGAEVFKTKCAVCHGDKGEGKVGPNLTDAYWLHGGDIKAVFKTIKYGVPAKGMVAWQNSMNGGQMQELASYILTLQGTNPPGAKEPQGELMAGAGTTAATDSTTTTK